MFIRSGYAHPPRIDFRNEGDKEDLDSMSSSLRDDRALIVASRRGRRRPSALYDSTPPGLGLQPGSGDTGEAEEVLQEVFLRAECRGDFRPRERSVLAWLLVATRSRATTASDTTPAARGFDPGRPGSDKPDPRVTSRRTGDSRVGDPVPRGDCGAAPEQRLALELAYFEGLTHQEISQKHRPRSGR